MLRPRAPCRDGRNAGPECLDPGDPEALILEAANEHIGGAELLGKVSICQVRNDLDPIAALNHSTHILLRPREAGLDQDQLDIPASLAKSLDHVRDLPKTVAVDERADRDDAATLVVPP